MRRLGTSSCPWRPVRSLRPPPSSGQRTTSSSATAPGSKWRQRAERNQNCFCWGFFPHDSFPVKPPTVKTLSVSLSVCLFYSWFLLSLQLQADVHQPWQGWSGQILCGGNRHRWSLCQSHTDWGRYGVRFYHQSRSIHYHYHCWSTLRSCFVCVSSAALNTMLELSHAIRHPSESKNNVPSISDTVKTLLFFSFFFLYIYRGTVFLSVRSRSSETRPELRSPGERSRAFLGAGRQTVLLCQLQVHRERQGSCCWRGVLSTSDFF